MIAHPYFSQIAELAEKIEPVAETYADAASLTLKVSKQFEGNDPAVIRAAIETARGRIAMRKEYPALAKGFF